MNLVSPEDMRDHPLPESLYSNFLDNLDEEGVSAKTRNEVAPAIQQLFDLLRRDVKLTDNSIVAQMRRNTNIAVVGVLALSLHSVGAD
jgi:hypothetical protein